MNHDADNSSSDLERQLAVLLDDLTDVQDEMLTLLAKKRELMAEQDVAGMLDLQPRVESMCERLRECHERRGVLLAVAASNGCSAVTLGELAERFPAGEGTRYSSQVKKVSAQMRIVQLESLTNWVLAQRSLLHVSQLLEIIATGGRLQPTYGRSESPASQGALVDREV